jgi:threonine/homoserine/homoserine lactone efflux protein
MISVSQALTFGLASLLIIVIPGPSMLFVVGRALAYGRRTALASVVGNEITCRGRCSPLE